jgi:hypothetical protein
MNLLRTFFGLPKGELVWGLTEKGARIIGSSLPMKTINRNALEHDLLSAEVKMKLDRWNVGSNWISSYAIQRMKDGEIVRDRIPDWIFKLRLKEKSLTSALEVETHLKGRRRLESILASYEAKKDIRFVWYVVPTESFGKKILEAMPVYYSEKGEDWLTFSVIDQILKDTPNAKMFGKKGEMYLKDLCDLQEIKNESETIRCPSKCQALGRFDESAENVETDNQLKSGRKSQ